MDSHELYDQEFQKLLSEAASHDIESEAATTAMKNLEVFSKIRPPQPELEPIPYVPVTKWEKFKHGLGAVWDNETTRVTIKASGAFAGVAAVVYTQVHKDHVMDKTALQQANQRPS